MKGSNSTREKREIRFQKFRATLRKLLQTNENVFGQTQSFNEGMQMIRDH